ncbi:DUF3040 domain-containing protein [Conexibacter sp. CPCC 206217]|uniref:DUF3040 domain-containing protein n=1 Tax=Conexibacter sp. CPCC 206217 TaxID=3064574 RepID=UPI002720A789|nr:DUF3040 domain-containing protein [Conexibacter sp. CPCC 206217]MDO8212842.1 hypothetical protein [Conexibacter sp. CPCC 206217]
MTDPFGNEQPESPAAAPGMRMLRLIGAAEIALGLTLLIVGFAVSSTIVALIGAVLVASSGTLFFLSRSLGRRG